MTRLTGNLKNILGAAESGALRVFLAGSGDLLPRVSGTGMIANIAPLDIEAVAGAYDFSVYGNDQITPGGTWYVVQVVDARGNVVQTNSYVLVGAGPFDLSQLTPSEPVAPVAPATTGGAVVVAYAANVVFDCSLVEAGAPILFQIVLTGNVIGVSLVNINPGQLVTILVEQDNIGGHGFVFPANAWNAGAVDAGAGRRSVQIFQGMAGDGIGAVIAVAPLMVY